MIEKFIKGSVWETVKPLTIRGTDIPVGSRFEVVYPRRRENTLVAIKMLGAVAFRDKREDRGSLPKARPSRKKRGRFHLADELVRASALDGSKLVSKPEVPMEFFIREIATGHLWAGNMEQAPSFREVEFGEGNHYVSAENARVGVVTILMRPKKSQFNFLTDAAPWEIVGYDPFEGEVREIHTIPDVWWGNVQRLAALHRSLPREDGNKTRAQRIRRISNAVPLDDRKFNFAIFLDFVATPKNSFVAQRAAMVEKMAHAGITDYLMMNDNVILLEHDGDRVMMRLLFAEAIEVAELA